tara:strand:- start:3701 stop:4537 length:837 start_codon:yes stop_codon:yes gene_type:complete
MAHFLVFNNDNQYSTAEVKKLCSDFEVFILNVSVTIKKKDYNFIFIYTEWDESEADSISDDKTKKNLGRNLSKLIVSPILYYQDHGLGKSFTLWLKGNVYNHVSHPGEIPEQWKQISLQEDIEQLREANERYIGSDIVFEPSPTQNPNITLVSLDFKKSYNIDSSLNKEQTLNELSIIKKKIDEIVDEHIKEVEKFEEDNSSLIKNLKVIFPYIDSDVEIRDNNMELSKISKLDDKFFSEFYTIQEEIFEKDNMFENSEFTHTLKDERVKKLNKSSLN